jgi:hypothetical protein
MIHGLLHDELRIRRIQNECAGFITSRALQLLMPQQRIPDSPPTAPVEGVTWGVYRSAEVGRSEVCISLRNKRSGLTPTNAEAGSGVGVATGLERACATRGSRV